MNGEIFAGGLRGAFRLPVTALIWLCAATGISAQGYGGLGSDAGAYTEVVPPAAFTFPADHAAHPGFRIEWWYLTANLSDAEGADYGIQWTLFRIATAADGAGTGWASNLVWMGHAGLTSADGHFSAEKFARGGIGQADVQVAPFKAWIDDWEMAGQGDRGDALSDIELQAGAADFAYDLRAVTPLDPVPQGDNGYSLKSPDGQASYYYSQPFYKVSGTLRIEDREIPVSGLGWLDREWSSRPMREDQTGWDWFSLHLDSGEKVMAYRFRRTGGEADLAGTWIGANGTSEQLKDGDLVVTPLSTVEVGEREVPVRWRLDIPGHGLGIETAPLNAQSWMDLEFPYWEGPIRFSGTHSGVGYLEMTGYD